MGGDGGVQQSNGATGGDAGGAGDITVNLHWVNLTTTGDNVSGVLATSRGGNGGGDNMDSHRTDGGNGGRAGNVSIELQSKGNQSGQQTTVSTNGVEAIGVSAQSIGGFGGSAVDNAGEGQNGGTADITTDANSIITTASDYAIGMLAQSIGGGVVAGSVDGGIVALGGDGGAGGAGGSVTISGTPQVSTTGNSAIGVIAQSIGGGGGTAGSATGLFAVGGSVSNSQNNSAGTVNVAVDTVSTQGDGSIGVLAQSIGGGGSGAGITAVGGSGESGGSGGAVTVDPSTNITTLGDYALAHQRLSVQPVGATWIRPTPVHVASSCESPRS